jgi:AcrR family transcriptional regulator
MRATCVAALGLFVCLAVCTPAEAEISAGITGSTVDDQWLHARTMLRQRRRGARVDRGRITTGAPPPPRRVVSREQVTAGARQLFLDRGTVDMDELAVRLAISRATLYRIVHSRDQLLGEVIWRLAEEALGRARRARRQTGVDGVLEVTRGFSSRIRRSGSFRHFLTREPETATRVLLTRIGGVHPRAVEAQKMVFCEAAPPGSAPGGWLRGDVDTLAYLCVRIFESMCYAELLCGRAPDDTLIEDAARALLLSAV